MMVNYEQDERARRHFHWQSAVYAGLLVGALFLAVSRGGHPWSSFGWPTHVMGRPFLENDSPMAFILRAFAQMILSVGYSFAIAAVVYRMKTVQAFFGGALIGLVLYGVNYLLFHLVSNDMTSETLVMVTHVAFGLMAAGAYKGFSIPKQRAPKSVR